MARILIVEDDELMSQGLRDQLEFEGYEVDHMIPISKGGLHHQDNLCYLPALVNRSKGGRTIEEFGEKEFNENVINWKSIVPL